MSLKPLVLAASMLVMLAAAPLSNAEICNKAQGCEFWDSQYHEYILNDVDTNKIDVIILPSASPYATREIATIEAGIQAWEDGILALGASWLTSQFEINHYTLGYDVIPEDALSDPEVVVISSEHNPVLLFGIGLANPFPICSSVNPLGSLAWHQHEGSPWAMANVGCAAGGHQCVVLNTNFLLGGVRRMYDLNTHEFGHCLGVGHVGDALDFDAKTVPLDDIMSYQYDPSQVHCVSTLNVRSIEGVYAKAFGRPSSEWLDSGDYYHMNPSAYSQVSCANPSANLVNLPDPL